MNALPDTPTGDTPVYRALVAAHDEYFRRLAKLIALTLRPTTSAIDQWLPLALYHHVFQLARATQALVDLGYSEEPMPIGRAMISATMNLTFIVASGNAGGWSMRYWVQLDELESRMLTRELELARFDPAKLKAIGEEASKESRLGGFRLPSTGRELSGQAGQSWRKGPRKDTWTGLSDKDLAAHLGMADWYATEYDYASTISHVQAAAVLPTGRALMDGQGLNFGPHFRSPLPTLTVSFNALRYSSLAAMKYYKLTGVDTEFQIANQAMSAAIDRYRTDSGANAVLDTILGKEFDTG